MNKNPEKFAIEYLIRNGFKLEEDYNLTIMDIDWEDGQEELEQTYLIRWDWLGDE